MKHILSLAAFILIAFFLISPTNSQNDCPALVRSALDVTARVCEGTGRNQACYGNVLLDAIPQVDIADLAFNAPGDIVDVATVKTLRLSSMNALLHEWGVALMRLQANLPETLPGQNVVMLLFGDVEITDAGDAVAPTFDVHAKRDMNVRAGPSRDEEIVATLSDEDIILADGRNQQGNWLRVQLPDHRSGWVFASLVEGGGDLNTLRESRSDEAKPPDFGPMQAFYFTSGFGDAPCEEAPESGILVQTPQGAGQIQFSINGVETTLGSTVYLQSRPANEMQVTVLDGTARLEATGVTVQAPAGTRVRVPLDASGAASGAPIGPEPYDAEALTALPLSVLPVKVSIAAPLTPEEIAQLADPLYRIGPDDLCTIAVKRAANLRSGPGTGYDVSGALNPGETRQPDGQATSVDGKTWWHLPGEIWVRADIVNSAGDCSHLQTVATPPAAAPVASAPGKTIAFKQGTWHLVETLASHTCAFYAPPGGPFSLILTLTADGDLAVTFYADGSTSIFPAAGGSTYTSIKHYSFFNPPTGVHASGTSVYSITFTTATALVGERALLDDANCETHWSFVGTAE